MKKIIKTLIPKPVFNLLLSPYHLARAVAANVIYGFPARKLRVIGVTGTNGKTTSINFIASVLRAAGYKVGVSTTANFRVGDATWDNELNMTTTNPFSLQKLLKKMKTKKVEWVILEVTSHALKQHRTWGMPIHTAVMTNLSPDHLDYHGNMEDYAGSKARLIKQAKEVIVLNRDDEWYDYFRKAATRAVYTYGTHEQADVRLIKSKLSSDSSRVKIKYGQRTLDADIRLPGKFNVYNALAATAVAYGLEISWEDVCRGLGALSGVPGRMETINAGQDFSVIVDYAHTPDAFENVFKTLRPVTKGKVIAVFGGAPTHDYEGLGRVAGELADITIITDDEPMERDPEELRAKIVAAARAGSAKVHDIADRREGIKKAFALAGPGDTVALLCLGHQKYRRYAGKRIEWDDRKVARELLKELADK